MWKQKMTNCRKRFEKENLEGELEDVPEEEHEQGVGGETLGQDAATLEDKHLEPHKEETKAWDAGGQRLLIFLLQCSKSTLNCSIVRSDIALEALEASSTHILSI